MHVWVPWQPGRIPVTPDPRDAGVVRNPQLVKILDGVTSSVATSLNSRSCGFTVHVRFHSPYTAHAQMLFVVQKNYRLERVEAVRVA